MKTIRKKTLRCLGGAAAVGRRTFDLVYSHGFDCRSGRNQAPTSTQPSIPPG